MTSTLTSFRSALQVLHEKICTKMLKGYPWDRTTHTMLCAGGEDKVSSYT